MRILWPDAVVPYVRMTARGKWVKPRALRYLSWRGAMRDALSLLLVMARAAPTGPVPGLWDRPLSLSLRFPGGRGDLDNLVKAVADVLQGLVYRNDRQVRRLEAAFWDDDCTLVEVRCL